MNSPITEVGVIYPRDQEDGQSHWKKKEKGKI